jgi:hypothetical protein
VMSDGITLTVALPCHNSDARHRRRRRVSTGLERGRRPAAGALYSGAMREEDGPPAGHRGDPEHATGAGPDLRGPAPTGRTKIDRTDSGADGRRHSTARSLARAALPARAIMRERPLGRGSIVTQTRTTRHYHSADSHPAAKPGESGPTRSQPECGRRLAASRPLRNGAATRNPPVAQPGADATRRRQPNPGPPCHTRGHPDRGLRRAATQTRRNCIPDHTGCPAGEGTRLSTGGPTQGRRVSTAVNKTAGSGEPQPAPGATATWNTPVAQSEEVGWFRV